MSGFKFVTVTCATSVAALQTAGGQTPRDTLLKRELLAENIYLFRAPSDLDKWTATNVVVVINDQDVTVFDSNTRPVTTRMVIAEIRKLTPKPVRTLINSHWHMDHWSGNDEYVKTFPGVQIIATSETRDFMKRMPRRFFADGLNASITRSRVALDSAMRSGKQRDGSPLTADARKKQEDAIAETARFARRLQAMDASIVVPGQGPAFHYKAYLKLTADLFASIVAQVHAALERGLVSGADVQAAVNVDAIGRQYTQGGADPGPRFRSLVSELVRKVHQESLDGVVK